MHMRHIIFFGFLLGLNLVFPLSSYAQVAYTVTPLVIDVKAEARDILTKKITITNTGGAMSTIYPTVNNISLDAGGTIQEFHSPVESDRTASLASWIEISRAGINVPVGESKTIDITLRINPNPVPGTYHAFVGFGNGRNRDEAQAQVNNGTAPGTIITLTIEDKKLEFLKLSRFIIDRFITKQGNQAALYTIKNPGDEALVPTGEIIFYDNKGVEVSSLTVNGEGQSIPPGEEREFKVDVPTQGLFGKYKAFLNVEYGTAQKASVQDTSFFYVLPMKIILSILGVLSIVVIVLALYVHRKYFDDSFVDDSDTLPLHIRDTESDPMHHDIDLSKKNEQQ